MTENKQTTEIDQSEPEVDRHLEQVIKEMRAAENHDSQLATYVPECGYWIGPTLPVGEVPWPLFWERQPDLDDCLHEWERVIIQRPHAHDGAEPVVRCRKCSAPRCGDSTDRDPCMERRHHRTTHLTLHGSFEPVGGYLREEQADA